MKKLLPYLVLGLLLLWPQLLLTNFAGVVVAWIFTGVIMAWFEQGRFLFLKGLIVEMILAFLILYFLVGDNSHWIAEVLRNNGISEAMAGILFVAINGLNAAFCLLIGGSLVRLIRPKVTKA